MAVSIRAAANVDLELTTQQACSLILNPVKMVPFSSSFESKGNKSLET